LKATAKQLKNKLKAMGLKKVRETWPKGRWVLSNPGFEGSIKAVSRFCFCRFSNWRAKFFLILLKNDF
jgi:hypothetical protein